MHKSPNFLVYFWTACRTSILGHHLKLSILKTKPRLGFSPRFPMFDSCAHLLLLSKVRNPGDIFESSLLINPHFQSLIKFFCSSEFPLNLPFPSHSLCHGSSAVTPHFMPKFLQWPQILFPLSCISLPINTISYFAVFSVTKSKKDLCALAPSYSSRLVSHNFLECTLAPDRPVSSLTPEVLHSFSPLAFSVHFPLPGMPLLFVLTWKLFTPSSLRPSSWRLPWLSLFMSVYHFPHSSCLPVEIVSFWRGWFMDVMFL